MAVNTNRTRAVYAGTVYNLTITVTEVNETIAKAEVFNYQNALIAALNNSPYFVAALAESDSSIRSADSDVGMFFSFPLLFSSFFYCYFFFFFLLFPFLLSSACLTFKILTYNNRSYTYTDTHSPTWG